MTEPVLDFVVCPEPIGGPGATHRMAYWQWGNPAASHVIVCAHGLSRQGRDFDVLAQALVARGGQGVRVVCPDVVGRGQSDWLKDPMGYQIPNYAGDMLALLAKLNARRLDWIGTSMGGLIGVLIAGSQGMAAKAASAAAQGSAPPVPAAPGFGVNKLVLNDVGPVIEWDAIQRIGLYLGNAPRFASVQQAATAMWAISTGFGPHTPEQWLALSRHMVKPANNATPGANNTDAEAVVLHYDPAIALPFRAITREAAAAGEAAVWQLYDNIQADTLLLRGSESDVLSKETTASMLARGPRPRLVEFAGVGHAPTLIAPDQVQAVLDFIFT